MAFHHHHHHHQTTAATCCSSSCTCQTPPYHHPQPPLFISPPPQTTTDPFLIATIVSQLLQTQNPQNHINNKPTNTNPFHHHQHQHLTYPSSKQTHSHSSDFLSSLLQRIDNLETTLHQFSSNVTSSSCYSNHSHLYLKNAAARVIQTHFRAFLVRRSTTLRHLKHLANVKSTLTCLKSSFSPHGFVDFDTLSHKSMDLLSILDSIQGENQMIRDSKKSITREIVQFLELIDGVCVKRHQVLTRKVKNMRLVRNENARTGHDTHQRYAESSRGSKCRNVDNEEKKLIANLRERVERIGRMSRALDAEEVGGDVVEEFEHVSGDDGDVMDQINGHYGVKNGAVSVNKNVLRSVGRKRVCFVEDGDVIRVYNVAGDKITTSRDVEEIEDTLKGREDEAQSDGDQSSQSSEGMRNQRSYEVVANHDDEFTFSAPDPKADFSSRKPGVKIAG